MSSSSPTSRELGDRERAAIRELVERTCAEQVKITDPTVIRKVATLLGAPPRR